MGAERPVVRRRRVVDSGVRIRRPPALRGTGREHRGASRRGRGAPGAPHLPRGRGPAGGPPARPGRGAPDPCRPRGEGGRAARRRPEACPAGVRPPASAGRTGGRDRRGARSRGPMSRRAGGDALARGPGRRAARPAPQPPGRAALHRRVERAPGPRRAGRAPAPRSAPAGGKGGEAGGVPTGRAGEGADLAPDARAGPAAARSRAAGATGPRPVGRGFPPAGIADALRRRRRGPLRRGPPRGPGGASLRERRPVDIDPWAVLLEQLTEVPEEGVPAGREGGKRE